TAAPCVASARSGAAVPRPALPSTWQRSPPHAATPYSKSSIDACSHAASCPWSPWSPACANFSSISTPSPQNTMPNSNKSLDPSTQSLSPCGRGDPVVPAARSSPLSHEAGEGQGEGLGGLHQLGAVAADEDAALQGQHGAVDQPRPPQPLRLREPGRKRDVDLRRHQRADRDGDLAAAEDGV